MIAGFAFWWFSSAQVLKRRTESLLTTLTMDSGSAITVRQMGGYSLNALLADEVTLENPVLKEADGSFERAEIESAYAWLCSQAKQTRFTLDDIKSVTISGNKATVKLALTALVELPTYRPVDGKFDATMDWSKGEDGWRLNRANWVESAN